jgi:hypothetical protein
VGPSLITIGGSWLGLERVLAGAFLKVNRPRPISVQERPGDGVPVSAPQPPKKRPPAGDDLGWLLAVCRRGLAGCRRRKPEDVTEAFMALTGALNFEYKTAALGLAALYARCLLHATRRRFALPRRVLAEVHAACLAAAPGDWRGRP